MKSKLISLIVFLLLFISSFPCFTQAVSINLEKDFICDTRQIFEQICYQGNLISIPYTVTYIDENSYPIYCENQEKEGASLEFSYTVQTQSTLKNKKIQKIMELGYPNCNIEDLGCWDSVEAYVITQLAIFDTYYHYDLTQFTKKEDASISENFISNLITFIQKCRNLNSEQAYPEIAIDAENIQWQEENENYCSKIYEIKSNEKLEKYEVEILGDSENKILILDEQNKCKNEFLQGEKFKILLPINKTVSFQIQVKAKFSIPSILVGKPFNSEYQEYFFYSDTQILTEQLFQEYFLKQEDINDDIIINKEEEKKPQITSYQLVETEKKESKILPQTGF